MKQINGNGALNTLGTRGIIGGLWSEWGNMSQFTGSGITGYSSWTADSDSNGDHYQFNAGNGYASGSGVGDSTATYEVVCRLGL